MFIRGDICGHCGKQTGYTRTRKMTHSGYGNIICDDCRSAMVLEIEAIAKKYLTTSPEAIKTAKRLNKQAKPAPAMKRPKRVKKC